MRLTSLALSAFLLSGGFAFGADDTVESDISSDAAQTVQDGARDMAEDQPTWDERIINWALDKNEAEHPELKKDDE